MDVFHGAEELRDEWFGFVFGGVDFVAHRDVPDFGARKVWEDVVFDPLGGVEFQGVEVDVRDVKDELDVGPV